MMKMADGLIRIHELLWVSHTLQDNGHPSNTCTVSRQITQRLTFNA
jgi:hypothetical protein